MKKKILQRNVLSYTTVFEPEEEGGYTVHVPSLPGCITQGDTFEEAQKNAQEAIALYVEVLKERREEIPVESGGTIVSRISTPFPA